MLTDEQIEVLSDTLTPLFQYLEQEIITDVARRIKKTMTYTRTAELQAMSMAEMGYSPSKIRSEAMKLLNADPAFRKEVAQNTMAYKREIRNIINGITREALKTGDSIVASAGMMSWVNDLSVWKSQGKELNNGFLPTMISAISEQTIDVLKNITNTTGFKTMSGMESIEMLYRNELDKAVIKICSGTFDQQTVLKEVVHNLADSGLRSIDYASGRSMQLDTAARVALRTGCHQLSAQIMDSNIKQTNENLVYVSSHWGARNEGIGVANHEQWQGKLYFIKPGTDYSAEAQRIGQDRILDLWYATGYSVDGAHANNPLGLHGYNCRHHHYVWFLGASSLPKVQPVPAPVTINGKTYDYFAMTKKLRSMERSIRGLKREQDACQRLGHPVDELSTKISQKTREYKEFSVSAGVPVKTSRLRYESGSTDITKTNAYHDYHKIIEDSKDAFDGSQEQYRKGATFRKITGDNIEIVDNATYNKIIRPVLKNGGVVIRGTEEIESHLAKYDATASCIGDVLLFSKHITVSDVLEETYHFKQNRLKQNIDKPLQEKIILNEIDAKEYLLSMEKKYKIPIRETEITRTQLESYRKELIKLYENN
jgi:hypothetical protein